MAFVRGLDACRIGLDEWFKQATRSRTDFILTAGTIVLLLLLLILAFQSNPALASVARLPGEDASDRLEAAGTLLKILDTGIFQWGARIFAGLCIMSSAWALKEQRFGIAVICVVGAIIFGTAPKWVKNIFEIGDNQGLFSQSGAEGASAILGIRASFSWEESRYADRVPSRCSEDTFAASH